MHIVDIIVKSNKLYDSSQISRYLAKRLLSLTSPTSLWDKLYHVHPKSSTLTIGEWANSSREANYAGGPQCCYTSKQILEPNSFGRKYCKTAGRDFSNGAIVQSSQSPLESSPPGYWHLEVGWPLKFCQLEALGYDFRQSPSWLPTLLSTRWSVIIWKPNGQKFGLWDSIVRQIGSNKSRWGKQDKVKSHIDSSDTGKKHIHMNLQHRLTTPKDAV